MRRNQINNPKEFGAYLKKLRAERNLSGRYVAEKIGMSNPFYYQLEVGKRYGAGIEAFRSLSAFYNIPIEKMLQKAGYLKNYAAKTAEEKNFLRIYEKLSPFNRKILGKLIKGLLELQE